MNSYIFDMSNQSCPLSFSHSTEAPDRMLYHISETTCLNFGLHFHQIPNASTPFFKISAAKIVLVWNKAFITALVFLRCGYPEVPHSERLLNYPEEFCSNKILKGKKENQWILLAPISTSDHMMHFKYCNKADTYSFKKKKLNWVFLKGKARISKNLDFSESYKSANENTFYQRQTSITVPIEKLHTCSTVTFCCLTVLNLRRIKSIYFSFFYTL